MFLLALELGLAPRQNRYRTLVPGRVDQGAVNSNISLAGSTMVRKESGQTGGSVARLRARAPYCGSFIAAGNLSLALILIQHPACALEPHQSARHPSAVHHQPLFITAPGETDVLLVVIALVVVAAILGFGVFFFWLHNLPERLVHNSTKAQFDIVASLALISLLTHMHLFWVLALLIALVKIPMPDFTGLLGRIAGSLEQIADATPGKRTGPSESSDPPPQGT